MGGDAPGGGDLLDAAAAGEHWALTALYRQLQPGLLRFLTAMAGDEGEDVAAEVWIDAARALPTFTGDERAFRGLLFTIGRRRVIDRARARHRRRTVAVDPVLLSEAGEPAGDVADAVADTDASRQAVARIRRLLPAEQAEIVLLRVVGGLTVGEVARIVGRTPAAVSVLQTRALQRLAQRLGPAPGGRRPVRAGPPAQVSGESGRGDDSVQDPGPKERWSG